MPGGRRGAWAPVLAWGWCAATLLVVISYLVLDRAARAGGRPDLAMLAPFAIPPTVAAVAAALVGAVLGSRRPRHPAGWLLLGMGGDLAVSGWIAGYLPLAVLVRPGELPAVRAAALAYPTTVVLVFTVIGFLLLLTPSGTLPSRRWRPWVLVAAATPAVLALFVPFLPGAIALERLIRDGPLAVGAFGGALGAAFSAAMALALAGVPLGALSLVLRYRRASGVEHQQLRWLTLAAVLVGVGMVAAAVLLALDLQLLLGWLTVVLVALLPLAVGASVLRYRLYDLDRIISRTVAYALLTLLLGLAYGAAVLLLGQLFGGLGEQLPAWAVACATLAVAALFQPARARVQRAVDRRFNRRRYDAARTIAAFSTRLRDQTDLDTLASGLIGVVDQTMQPSHASLWLR